jgi:hypothetical protein
MLSWASSYWKPLALSSPAASSAFGGYNTADKPNIVTSLTAAASSGKSAGSSVSR